MKLKIILAILSVALIIVIHSAYKNLDYTTRDAYIVKTIVTPATSSSPINMENMRQHSKDCVQDEDCTLVKSPYCGNIIAVNRNAEKEWLEENTKLALTPLNCKPMNAESTNENNFNAICLNNQCEARIK